MIQLSISNYNEMLEEENRTMNRLIFLFATTALLMIGTVHAEKPAFTFGLVVSFVDNTITTCHAITGTLAEDLAESKKATPEADVVLFSDPGTKVTDIKQAHSIAVRELGESGNPVIVAFFTDNPMQCGSLRLGLIKSQGLEPAE